MYLFITPCNQKARCLLRSGVMRGKGLHRLRLLLAFATSARSTALQHFGARPLPVPQTHTLVMHKEARSAPRALLCRATQVPGKKPSSQQGGQLTSFLSLALKFPSTGQPSSSLEPSTFTLPFWKYRNCVSESTRQQPGWVWASQNHRITEC